MNEILLFVAGVFLGIALTLKFSDVGDTRTLKSINAELKEVLKDLKKKDKE